MKKVMVFLILFSLNPLMAHPGPVNNKGCHINSDTGRQHCHKAKQEKSQVQRVKKTEKNKKRKNSRQEKLFSKI
ncbi:MAG: YHYH domain-containing protein [Bdellovibrionales bacterium]|nr:YHYH domain-containing protein [Bdellovibrionales bacterium]NQZ19225.1 YHYH domain-containing protein [Bdellovibrionales bacterium]